MYVHAPHGARSLFVVALLFAACKATPSARPSAIPPSRTAVALAAIGTPILPAAQATNCPAPLHSDGHFDYGAPSPEYAALTIDQKLDRALSQPGFQGVLRGKAGTPTAHTLSASHSATEVVTDFPFAVHDILGPDASPYSAGKSITLRILGGCTKDIAATFRGAPSILAGEELFVVVRDVGEIAGGNTAMVVVAPAAADVFELRNNVVHGQGEWSSLVEPLATFEQHFKR